MEECRWDDVEWPSYHDLAYHHDGDDADYNQYDLPVELVLKDGKWGMTDARTLDDGRGEIIFPPQWDEYDQLGSGYSRDGSPDDAVYFIVVRQGEKWGVVDTTGRVVSPCQWDEIDPYGNVRLGQKWGFIHLLTGEIIQPQWQENQRLHPYVEGFKAEDANNYAAWFDGTHYWVCTMIIFKTESPATNNGR